VLLCLPGRGLKALASNPVTLFSYFNVAVLAGAVPGLMGRGDPGPPALQPERRSAPRLPGSGLTVLGRAWAIRMMEGRVEAR
jgi:hypothetical protein